MDKMNLYNKLCEVSDHWRPQIVGELNGQHVAVVKLLGESVWCEHELEDIFFLVVKGRFRIDFRDHSVSLEDGDFLIVPCKVTHRPVAETEVHVLLFERKRRMPHVL
ncbi:MAG TPA: cupin domain-containing protein [Pirellulales bacterium]|jgi:mannose-6-phosphate isomerase-like protein (cupin superfamily)